VLCGNTIAHPRLDQYCCKRKIASWNVGADGLRRALDDESRAAAGAVSLALARDFVNLVIDRANGDDDRTTPCGMRAARRGAPRPTPPHITGALRPTTATDDDDVDARLSAKARKGRNAHARAARDNPPSVMCDVPSVVHCVRARWNPRWGARASDENCRGVGQVALGYTASRGDEAGGRDGERR
jgi:hypothetical protein